jgi:very-short-patch-repair endonuclease
MRNEMTLAEKKLWYDYLRQSEHRWLRQKAVGNFIVDFYCPKVKLVIEIDGVTHLKDKEIIYDRNRTRELEKLGIKVLRFWNDDILQGIGEVEIIIEKEIENRKLNPPTPFVKGGN